MNTQLQLHQSTPADLMAVQKWTIQRMIELMRPFGISGITTTWSPVGMSGTLGLSFTPVDRDPPGSFSTLQPRMVRWIAEGMQIFGILAIETSPTEDDLKELYSMWETAAAFRLDTPTTPAESTTVKTPPTTDPTNKNAL